MNDDLNEDLLAEDKSHNGSSNLNAYLGGYNSGHGTYNSSLKNREFADSMYSDRDRDFAYPIM